MAQLPPSPPPDDAPRAGRPAAAWAAAAAAGAAVLACGAWAGRVEPWTAAAAVAASLAAAFAMTTRRRRADAVSAFGDAPAIIAAPPEIDQRSYLLALEFAPDPVMLVSGAEPDDLAGRRIGFANAAARELLRIPREGALLVAALRHPDVLEAVDESLFGRLERSLDYETGGAPTRHWRVWTRPLPASGDWRLALLIMRDETDARRAERMRADFLANASHELRTPLASLKGFIETLRGHAREDPAARERFLAIMSAQAERMARLIDDLMSLSRIELSEHVRPSGVCDLSLAVMDVVDALAPQIQAKGVALDMRLAQSAAVTGDRDQIVQVVQNLLDNAIKYSPPGAPVRIEVAAGLSLDAASASQPDSPRLTKADGGRMSLVNPAWTGGERYTLLQVVDAGAGIDREHLPRLSERFYRVGGQKSSDRGGTGLGLAIVKHIVSRHRGGFYVESAPGGGSAFCVYFPMAAEAAAKAPAPPAAEPRLAAPPQTSPSPAVAGR